MITHVWNTLSLWNLAYLMFVWLFVYSKHRFKILSIILVSSILFLYEKREPICVKLFLKFNPQIFKIHQAIDLQFWFENEKKNYTICRKWCMLKSNEYISFFFLMKRIGIHNIQYTFMQPTVTVLDLNLAVYECKYVSVCCTFSIFISASG